MKKFLLGILCLAGSICISRAEGIRFFEGNYKEAIQKAVEEKKLIFMDVYTPWCGPCLNMEDKVFSLPGVGDFYNQHFVSIRVDWESPEGKILAQRFYVASFPAFLFIRPDDEKVVHEHGGSQRAEVFLQIGRAALDSSLCSSFLTSAYLRGERDKTLLLHYAAYRAERREMKEAIRLLDEAIKMYGLSLEEPEVARFFFSYFTINEINHPLGQYFLTHRQQMAERYGKEKVDRKLFELYRYCSDRKQLEQLAGFNGKKFLLASWDFNHLAAQGKYEEAHQVMLAMIRDPETDRQELYDLMLFTARGVMKRGGDREWKKTCLSYLQYVAYNQENRRDPEIHYQYALLLEHFIRENPETHAFFPESITAGPREGRQKYSLNSRMLAPKKEFRPEK